MMDNLDDTLSYECKKCRGDLLYRGLTCPRCDGTGYDPGDDEEDE